jgi:hypothetical protein
MSFVSSLLPTLRLFVPSFFFVFYSFLFLGFFCWFSFIKYSSTTTSSACLRPLLFAIVLFPFPPAVRPTLRPWKTNLSLFTVNLHFRNIALLPSPAFTLHHSLTPLPPRVGLMCLPTASFLHQSYSVLLLLLCFVVLLCGLQSPCIYMFFSCCGDLSTGDHISSSTNPDRSPIVLLLFQ